MKLPQRKQTGSNSQGDKRRGGVAHFFANRATRSRWHLGGDGQDLQDVAVTDLELRVEEVKLSRMGLQSTPPWLIIKQISC